MTWSTIAARFLPTALYYRLAGSDVLKRLARGSFWSLVNSVAVKFLALMQAIVLARMMGISEFGEWGLLLSTIATVSVFASFGLGATTSKHVAQWHAADPERLASLLSLLRLAALSMGVLAFVLLAFGAETVTALIDAPQLTGTLALVGIIVLCNSIASIHAGILTGLERFRTIAILEFILAVIGIGLVLGSAYLYGVSGAVLGLALTTLLRTFIYSVSATTLLQNRNIPVFAKPVFAQWIIIRDFAVPATFSGITIMLSLWVSHAVLVRQPGGFEEMGAYQAANQWRTLLAFLPTQLLAAYLPVLSSLLTERPTHMAALQRGALLTVIGIALMLALPTIFLAPQLMSFYGDEFSSYWPILAVVALIPIFDMAHVVFHNTAIARGYAWTLVLSNLMMVACVVLGIFWLIPSFLGLGLAATLLLGYAMRAGAEFFIYLRHN